MNVRDLAYMAADIAAELSTLRDPISTGDTLVNVDLPGLIESARKDAILSTLRDPIVQAALNVYIDTLRQQIADARDHNPDLLSGLESDLNAALALLTPTKGAE